MGSRNHNNEEGRNRNRLFSSGYTLNVKLEFGLVDENGTCRTGKGQIVDCSEKEVSFRTDEALPTGVNVELFIPWPFSTLAAIQLQISGQTIPNDRNCCAVKILHDRF